MLEEFLPEVEAEDFGDDGLAISRLRLGECCRVALGEERGRAVRRARQPDRAFDLGLRLLRGLAAQRLLLGRRLNLHRVAVLIWLDVPAGTFDLEVERARSAPARTGSASCALTVQTIPPGCEGGPPAMGGVPAGGATGVSCPRPIVPRYEVCEAYKVVTRYGIPLFAITTLLAGLYLMVSMGRPERVTRGKQVFGASIAGLLIIILAKPLLVTMLTFLGFQVFLCGQPIP